MDIGTIGIWTNKLEFLPAAQAQELARELEALGYGALWFPETLGREALTQAALLLAATQRMTIATGIANIWARDAVAMANAQRTLTEAYPDRFLLGLGVSHAPTVEQVRGHRYRRPVAYMRAYLEAMDRAPFTAVPPRTAPRRVLAALGPKMLALAAERAWGAHPYFVPVAHTAQARQLLGPAPLLAPEQAIVLETEPSRAREVARQHTARYLRLPNYVNNLRRLGFTEEDLTDGGSDRLVDAIVAWGDLDTVVRRIREHLAAGANHVCIQVLTAEPATIPREQWRELAAALLH
ncbi:MAG TPA: LLM class F420-dependent oxidoreductase [Chloroflexota bacterium]|nr:LLM class F420-dependent oxidoreductase [Chloroflexota bacterium]HZU06781.1 LLM class F420-dependent oxidoreductase [Chloroflexota bacterium]